MSHAGWAREEHDPDSRNAFTVEVTFESVFYFFFLFKIMFIKKVYFLKKTFILLKYS